MKFLPRMALALLLSAWPISYAAAQQLQCNPCSYDYGQVQIGTSKQYVFQLTNTGNQALTIGSKWKNSKDFSFSNFRLPVTLQPGQGTQMAVNFTPSTLGKITGRITLISNGTNSKLFIGVSGTGVNPTEANLAVSPSSLDFGSVTVGFSASLQLTLSASNGPVTISSAQVNSSEFTLPGFVLPKTIAAGQSVAARRAGLTQKSTLCSTLPPTTLTAQLAPGRLTITSSLPSMRIMCRARTRMK